ncbi:SulP family inorganic anion transporter [Larsenimonas suaedae]|uniref:SulP family inorganic anion transporter n=1 Tax=Larsenimonas suaedae TaxID=1851019 RepID=A0ABU1GSM2_9GAMM|nr:SulP family inorganic anion transporter [Larsenimonas suaedae]MCM2972177.1 SulP family inorganic anion transporter [Larsenimonas suaedae]MDR5895027.1 SulP family inorganic anion transporter [Larsenimonas suaedae]
MIGSLRQHWFSNVRNDVLSGLVVALALIPEAIAFSIIAGVDPAVGLYASFSMAFVISLAGGRPAMISAATGAMALVITSLVKDHGLDYLLAATILTGLIQIVFGYMKLGRWMRFVPRSVVTGFVNALAIMIFMAQLPELFGQPDAVWWICAGGLAIIYLFPYVPVIGKAIPSPMVCIVVMTAVALMFGIEANESFRTVGRLGELPDSLPTFLMPDVPFTLETLMIILPYSLSLAVVGLMESMMTATIVDDLTDTGSDKNKECRGQGIANVATGFIGGMAGCGMIGQTVINVKSGGRTRLSTMVAGVGLLIMVVFLGDWVALIPMSALAAVMIMVSIGTFDWGSIRELPKKPMTTNIVMLATVAVVLYTHNLAIGVVTGTLIAAIFFANKIAHYLRITSTLDEDGETRRYDVRGQVFFASTEAFTNAFDFKESLAHVHIDVSHAHFWDITAVDALDRVVIKFRREGCEVEVHGLNEASQTLVDRHGVHDKPDALDKPIEH